VATSGTYTFAPSLGELVLHAFDMCEIRGTALLQEHMQSARMHANLMQSEWSADGVNLWAVDLQEIQLVQGQATYDVDPTTIAMLDSYIVQNNGGAGFIDRLILPISRTEYASYPNKQQQGFPTTYWFDRLLAPQVTLWPVPDGTVESFKFYRVRQIQDAVLAGGLQPEIPFYYLKAFAYGLAAALAISWKPEKLPILEPKAAQAYQKAINQNVETAQQFISPQIGGYYR
jgi:hypothetical protein